jgi:hypothetical protein
MTRDVTGRDRAVEGDDDAGTAALLGARRADGEVGEPEQEEGRGEGELLDGGTGHWNLEGLKLQ